MTLKKLFNKAIGRDPDKRNKNGETALYRAAKTGSLTQVRELLERGANPDIPNNQGLTPLHQAAYWGEVAIVDLLLRSGANPKADNGHGWTPLHSASLAGGLCGRDKIIDLLLKSGADETRKDKHGWMPKDYAELWKKEDPALPKLMQSYEGDQIVSPSCPIAPRQDVSFKSPQLRNMPKQGFSLVEAARAVFLLPQRPLFLSSRRVATHFHYKG